MITNLKTKLRGEESNIMEAKFIATCQNKIV